MVTFNDVCEYLYKPNIVFEEINNINFQSRLLRVFSANDIGVRVYLGNLPFEELFKGFEDFTQLLELGKGMLKISCDDIDTLNYEYRSLFFCDFLTLRELFEKNIHELQKVEIKSTFSVFQIYAVQALVEVINAQKAMRRVNLLKNNPLESNAALVDAISCSSAAQEILSHNNQHLYHETVLKTVDSLQQAINKDKTSRIEGGKYSRLAPAKEYFLKSAKSIWTLESIQGKPFTHVKDMFKSLNEEWDTVKALYDLGC